MFVNIWKKLKNKLMAGTSGRSDHRFGGVITCTPRPALVRSIRAKFANLQGIGSRFCRYRVQTYFLARIVGFLLFGPFMDGK